MESLSEAALAFAKECLNRPESLLVKDEIQTGLEFNLGPPGYLDASSFEVYDLLRIMQMASAWCQKHALELTLTYFDESYTCRIIVRDSDTGEVSEVFECSDHEVAYEGFAPCVDACCVLLETCVNVRRTVKRIIRHYESLK